MKMSLTALRVVVDSNIRGFMEATARNTTRGVLQAAAKDTITDSSTGTVLTTLAGISTQDSKVVLSGTNLASRSGFNTSIGKVNNAVAVLRDMLARNGFTPLSFTPAVTGGDGTVATQGTVPALDKTVTGVDGSAGDAMLRMEFNASIMRARNNLANLIRGYNMLATAVGVATLKNDTKGASSATLTAIALGNNVTATTAVAPASVASSDLAGKAAADAALLAIANDIASLTDKIKNTLLAAATLSARIPIILTR